MRRAVPLPLALCALLLSQLNPAALGAWQQVAGRATAALAAYVDGHPGQSLPVIVETSGDAAPVAASASAAGARDVRRLTDDAFSAVVSPDLLSRLERAPGVSRVNPNGRVRLLGSVKGAVDAGNLLNRYEAVSGIADAWRRGLDGTGVQIAVVDSGFWPHDDLVQSSPAVQSNQGNRLLPLVVNSHSNDALDHFGHGTHVAGIIAGNGLDSGGQYIGVAPNSLLVSVKASDDAGNLNEGDVITGLEWVRQANTHGLHIRIVNLSLASETAQSYNDSALDAMVEKLWKSGVLVVASAGSAGGDGVLYAPGNDPFAVTVGSVEDSYQTNLNKLAMATWSPYGNTQDGYAKPEVVADGSHVVSLQAPGSVLVNGHPANVVGGTYFKMGGTSMAAPQVSGLAALMLQDNPALTPDQVKQRLVDGSIAFGRIAYTPQLGYVPNGGLVSSGSVGLADPNLANVGVSWSRSFDPTTGAFLAGGRWWQDAKFRGASWDNTSWNNTSWNTTSWNNTSWNGTQFNSISWNTTSWNNISWNNTSWNATSWNNTSWNNTSWNNTSWNAGGEATFQ